MDWNYRRTQWNDWWCGLSPLRRALPVLLCLLYWAALTALDGLRSDLVISSVIPAVLFYLGPAFRPIFQFTLPLFITSILYDTQRYYADLIRGAIHVREPYDFDKYFFGITTSEGVLTPNEWWQKHTYSFLDFICGVAYIIFIPVYMACAAYFRFYLSYKGNRYSSAEATRLRSPQMMWAFFWVNIIG